MFRVSPSGNGCGLAVVALDGGPRPCLIQIHVMPKFWSTSAEVHVDLDEAIRGRAGFRVAVYEGQRLLVGSADAGLLDRLGDILAGLTFAPDPDSEEAEDDKPVALFAREPAVNTQRFLPSAFSGSGDPSPMWGLLTNAGATDLLRIPASALRNSDVATYLAGTMLAHVPELRPLHARLLIMEVEPVVLNRRREFRAVSGRLGAVRGRIDARDLPNRAAEGRQSVLCHFDELDNDTAWMRLMRAAVRQSARDLAAAGHDEFAGRGWRVDRHLSDIGLTPARRILKVVESKRIDRSDRPKRRAIMLSRSYLRGQFPFGVEDSPGDLKPGAAAAVRFSTARLFERLLATVRWDDGSGLRAFRGSVHLHAGSSTPASAKRPDLEWHSADGGIVMNVDAKYKRAPTSLQGMPMSDAYQQYGYAAATGRDTLFVYVQDDGPAVSEWREIIVRRTPAATRVGVTGVPFPRSGAVKEWRGAVAALFAGVMSIAGTRSLLGEFQAEFPHEEEGR
ncbi:MAG: hypothetical protein F2840_14815 [Actinobacteria bacterium]|uniref:Unannotated protein n=1 Tax=freshwater metagenome TaxID=449393 RepID=A0A6J7LH32_9ZZZZ|nr:hypothetical protein [Actinomycetota bacterium]